MFSFFLRFPQVDGLLWIWDRDVAFGGSIVVPADGDGCCVGLQVCGAHWRGLVVVVFLCVCGLHDCFQITRDFIGPFGYHKLHHKTPV